MSRAVGLQLQGDVFLGGAFGFSAIGRILKQMSDAGMDIYAVHALIQLGDLIPISQHQEAVVSAAMRKRRQSRQGWLVKGLTIGWGHSDPVYEISKTAGGCAALLTLNAFAAGTGALAAAEALQELMRLNGCEEGNLPAVDPLRNVVSALSPIMEDSGFHSVLQTVRLASIGELGRLLSGVDFEQERRSLMQDSRKPRYWADAAHQLLLAASMNHSIYLHTSVRAAWLAAFAVEILDMECSVVYYSHELWRAPGSNGQVTIQVAPNLPLPKAGFASKFKFYPDERVWDSVIQDVESTYQLRDALESELQLIPKLSFECREKIKYAIVQLFTFLSTRHCFTDQHFSEKNEATKITGSFPEVGKNIEAVCEQLGIDSHHLDRDVAFHLRSAAGGYQLQISRGSEWKLLPMDDQAELQDLCYCNDYGERNRGCSCAPTIVSNIICGFATTALALLPCYIDHPSLHVVAGNINGRCRSKWSEAAMQSLTDPAARVNLPMLLDHLRLLFFAEDVKELSRYAVAVSARATTVAIRVLLDEDAFGDSGQYIGIYSGRLTCDGCFRSVVEETGRWTGGGQSDELVWPATVAGGVRFIPANSEHLRRVRIDSKVEVSSRGFDVHCDLVPTSTELVHRTKYSLDEAKDGTTKVLFTCTIHDAIYSLLTAVIGKSCDHASNGAFIVPRRDTIFNSIQTGIFCVHPSEGSCAFIGVPESQSDILFSLCSVQGAVTSFVNMSQRCCLVLQGDLCLTCAYELAKRKYRRQERQYQSAAILCTIASSHWEVEGGISAPARPLTSNVEVVSKIPM